MKSDLTDKFVLKHEKFLILEIYVITGFVENIYINITYNSN